LSVCGIEVEFDDYDHVADLIAARLYDNQGGESQTELPSALPAHRQSSASGPTAFEPAIDFTDVRGKPGGRTQGSAETICLTSVAYSSEWPIFWPESDGDILSHLDGSTVSDQAETAGAD
jgi:hypothetical protein